MCKKILAIVLSLSLLFSFSMIANATTTNLTPIEKIPSNDNSEIQPLYNYTSNYSVSLSIKNGTAYCTADINGYSSATKIEITMTLQKKTLLWWSKVESWTTSVEDYIATLSEQTSVDSGTYRVKAEFKVYSGSASETITGYSPEQEC